MKKLLLFGLLAFAGYGLFGVVSFYIGKYMDYSKRPWAYSRDERAILLIGKWEGSFKDPDGIDKELKLEILVPETDSMRWHKAFMKHRRRYLNRDRNFDGLATVTSKLGTEYYELSGKVNEDDNHKIYLNFHPDEKKKKVLPDFFIVESGNAEWKIDEISFLSSFTYHKVNDVVLYESGNPKHKMKIKVNLQRVKI